MKILYTSLLFLMNCVLSVAQPEIIVPKPHQLKWHEAMQHPKLVNRLKSQLKTWLQKTEDPFFNYL